MDERALIEKDVETYLRKHEQKELLRFVAIGSVDDGKSTLIGRLLHDTNGIYDDQIQAVAKASRRGAGAGSVEAGAEGEIDFSLFTDGLKAEREQGITIDVAYRYFTTESRKFIIADTPGHVQYTRNMATGASTADVGVILVDARLGVLPQTRRHAFVSSLLGIPHLIVAVNKMDLRDWSEEVFKAIRDELAAFTSKLGFRSVDYLPISAKRGDNVVQPSKAMSWYRGPTVLSLLETIPLTEDRNLRDLRFPVQSVIRPNLDYRGFAGQIASGVIKVGEEVEVLPSRRRSRVTSIDTWNGPIQEAFAPMSVVVRLADEVDISRGDMLVHVEGVDQPATVAQRISANLVWLHGRPLDRSRSYFLKHTTQRVRAEVREIRAILDPETLQPQPAETLKLNDISEVVLETHRPLYVDPYRQNRSTGAFILIDTLTNDTVAAGMISSAETSSAEDSGSGRVSAAERRSRLGHGSCAITVVGETLAEARRRARALERGLFDAGVVAYALDDASDEPTQAVVNAGLVALRPSIGRPCLRVGSRELPGDAAVSVVVAALRQFDGG